MWNHPVTPSAASTASSNNDTTTSFPNELDFGASVDIQDEMCRTIKAECDDIDKSSSIAQTAVKNEERTLNQLSKDYGCAKNEMASLRRDGGDILDEETMTDDIRRGFKEQFEKEVFPHVTASNNDDGGDDDAALVSEDEGANNEDHHGIKRVYSHGKFLARKNSELKAKKALLQTTAQEIKSGKKNIQAVDVETASILQMIETRGLDAVKGQGERAIAQLQREVEVENQRNRGVKEAIQAARANSGVNAQTIAEKAKQQMTLRSEHLSKEAELTARNDAAQQEVSLVQAEQKKLAEELALLSGQLDFFTQNVSEYEAKQKRSDEIKTEMEGVKSDVVELISKKAIVSKDVEESSSELKKVENSYDEAKEAYDTIMSEKEEKERARDEAIKEAEARKAAAMKEKEILAGKIAKCQEETANQEGQGKDALSGSEARLVALTKTLKTREEQLEKKRSASDKMKEESASTLAAKAAQVVEMREMTSKFEAASKAEIDRLAVLKKERIESRVEHVEKRRSDLNLIEDCQRADIKNIRKKLGILEEVNKIKDSIKESKIVLDKNGNDRFIMPNVYEIDFGDGFDFDDL